MVLTQRRLTATAIPVAARIGLGAARPPTAALARGSALPGGIVAPSWHRPLMVTDGVAVLAGLAIAGAGRYGARSALAPSVPLVLLVAAAPMLWLLALRLSGAYEAPGVAVGRAEFGRIVNAGLWVLAAVVFGSYATHAEVSREVVALAVPATTALTLVAHIVVRRLLQRRIREGGALHRVVVAGTPSEVWGLVDHIGRMPHSGLQVAGVCLPTAPGYPPRPAGSPPLVGTVRDVVAVARRVGADTIAVAGTGILSGAALRRLSWDLEGTGIRLLVSWGAPELAGRRLRVQHLGGLPLVHVREAGFSGPPLMVKAAIDRAGAALLLVAVAPLLVVIALAVACTSRGPVLFRQTRVGLRGRPFTVLKFRTMRDGAEREQQRLSHLNEHDGLLFKMRHDPRVTLVGGLLRRFSLDELPQLWNVLVGSMSLVGPRPPLPAEVEGYPPDLRRRRHLVKPGITGLWQVSGRSDLTSEETVRLDLQYVENRSVALDTMVLWKTMRAVLSSRGAY